MVKTHNWRGIETWTDNYRVYKRTTKKPHRKGRLLKSFTYSQLLKLAWEIGVSNPEGFSDYDSKFLGYDDGDGFNSFISGWYDTNKSDLINYIWNRLYDTDNIICI